MRSALPDAVLRRPKVPVLCDPWSERVMECGLPPLNPAGALRRYVETKVLLENTLSGSARFWVDFRARSLNYWLLNMDSAEKRVR